MENVKIWLDDEREAPESFIRAYSVNEAISLINCNEDIGNKIELLDLDHDLGAYANEGGDAIKLLDYLVENDKLYPINLHTMNPVGRENMQRIIDRYWNKKIINKKIIEKLISIIPSNELREAYKKDLMVGIYPEWDIDEIMSFLHELIWHAKLDSIIEIIELVFDEIVDSEKKQKIYKIIKKLRHKGNDGKWAFNDYEEFNKYVILKNIHKGGDLIEFKYKGKITYGIVGNFDYNGDDKKYKEGTRYFDSSDMVYYAYILCEDVDISNPYDVYACHCHPEKFLVEKANENELTEGMQKYLKFLKEKVVFFDKEVINDWFDEYDKLHNKNVEK